MTLPLWGTLEKAQDNDQTINEAIVEAITEHEESATSHLGTDESLSAHKTEEVIDHPARSVFDDKFAFDRNVFDSNFSSLDPFGVIREVEQNGINSFMFTSSTTKLTCAITGTGSDMTNADMFYYQLNPRILTSFMVNAITDQTGYLIAGEMDEGRGFGFKISDNKLYGLYFKSDNAEDTLELITLVAGTIYKIEAVVTYPSTIDFYVNNVLIDSMDSASLVSSMDYVLLRPYIQWKGDSSSTRYLHVSGFRWEADLPT